MFCKHEWNVLSETVTKSKFESAIEATNGIIKNKINLPWQMCDASRKHIQVFTCDKCGKIRRFVEQI